MKYISLCFTCLILFACATSSEDLNVKSMIWQDTKIHINDLVTVITHENHSHNFYVVDFSSDYIIGDSERIQLKNIKNLKVEYCKHMTPKIREKIWAF